MQEGMLHTIRGILWTALRLTALTSLALLLVGAPARPAQATTLISETTWGGAQAESTGGAAVAPDGSTYLAGFTTSFGRPPALSVFVLKFAPDGSLTWQRTWSATDTFGNDSASDVGVAPDGSVYVVGATLGTGGDALLLKFSPEGTLLWQRNWGGTGNDHAESVAVGADGAVYVAGATTSFGTGDGDLFVVKFAPDGTLLWQQRWGSANHEEGQGVAVAPDGSVYVAGVATRPNGDFEFDVVLLKLNAAGTLIWQRAYAAGEVADARGGVAVAPDGTIYVAGGLQEPRQQIVDLNVLLVKFAPDGTLLWDRSWGGRDGDDAGDVAVAPDGTVLLAASTSSFGAGSDDAVLLRVQPGGKGIDAQTWGGAGLDHGTGVGVRPDGTISLGGVAEAPPYTFQRATDKLSRLRGSVTPATGTLLAAGGSVADPGGVVGTPAGSTTYAGGTDAMLLRIAP